MVGVDREQLLGDDRVSGWCLDALEANGVLVFRGLHTDDTTQVAFSKRLGHVERLPTTIRRRSSESRSTRRRILLAAYLRGTFDWHIDGCTDDVPIMATVLSAHAVAATGGETEFASSYAAYESLSTEERERADPCGSCTPSRQRSGSSMMTRRQKELAMWRSRPAKEHPLVWNHQSGRRSLVSGATADPMWSGWTSTKGRALLSDLLDKSTVAERVYRHEWQVGDMVIWDNRGVLHRATPYDPASPRDMHRCTLAGDEVIQ